MKYLIYTIGFASIFSQSGFARTGKEIYAANCVTCHGDKADGLGPAGQYLNPHPRNLVSDKFKNGDSPEQILKTITNGIDGTPMAPFKTLSEDDRKAVAAYIRSLRGGATQHPK